MEPQRGEEQLVRGKRNTGSNDAGAVDIAAGLGAAAGLCSGAAAASSARIALEQEVLYRADLQLQGAGTGGDRRRERMIKNRESAARSRARRHAYTNELEKEVSLLREENEQLKKLCDEVS
ncbi:bZIP transcription factor TRAB1-like isoform X2 [Phragmites australis]|uniref:bZIP transcription factor TRAB1-like isoform X2 n=1 Tax=Phragmites australis TaxID=29695 RepID=UPI002D78BA92|nr:bZIP transcription factor TRAB1-like isoform X2 [Phragmites australis]